MDSYTVVLTGPVDTDWWVGLVVAAVDGRVEGSGVPAVAQRNPPSALARRGVVVVVQVVFEGDPVVEGRCSVASSPQRQSVQVGWEEVALAMGIEKVFESLCWG